MFSCIVSPPDEREFSTAPKELILRAEEAIENARYAVEQFRNLSREREQVKADAALRLAAVKERATEDGVKGFR